MNKDVPRKIDRYFLRFFTVLSLNLLKLQIILQYLSSGTSNEQQFPLDPVLSIVQHILFSCFLAFSISVNIFIIALQLLFCEFLVFLYNIVRALLRIFHISHCFPAFVSISLYCIFFWPIISCFSFSVSDIDLFSQLIVAFYAQVLIVLISPFQFFSYITSTAFIPIHIAILFSILFSMLQINSNLDIVQHFSFLPLLFVFHIVITLFLYLVSLVNIFSLCSYLFFVSFFLICHYFFFTFHCYSFQSSI